MATAAVTNSRFLFLQRMLVAKEPLTDVFSTEPEEMTEELQAQGVCIRCHLWALSTAVLV